MIETVRSIVSVTRKNLLLLGLLIGVAAFGGFAYRASATSAGIGRAVDASAYDAESLWLRDEDEDILVPESAVSVVATYPIGEASQTDAPTVADVASVYSSSSAAFSGQTFAPGGQANTPAISRMMVDDLNLIGTAPYSISRFHFTACNLNGVAVSARPRVRFYLDNAGAPGTYIAGFTFNAATLAANSCSVFAANSTPFTVTSSQMWAGMLFDNGGGSTSTAVQINSWGMGVHPVPDAGTSADSFFLTTSAPPSGGSFLVNNPGPGASQNLGGSPLANFGWDLRLNALVASIVRADADPRPAGGTAQWTVTLSGGPVTGLSTANFALAGTHTGASLASVTPVNATTWTVTANLGAGAGTLGLNLANVNDLNTNVSNAPFTGEVYNVLCTATTTFNFTGAAQTFTVPAGVTSVNIQAFGAQGGIVFASTTNSGGSAQGDLAVTPGEVLNIYVGGQATGVTGGFNGGGTGQNGSPGSGGAGGGGASDVRQGGTALADRKIVGAGGGGGGSLFSGLDVVGGAGGGLTGGNGFRVPSDAGGGGGTQSSSANGTCSSLNNPAVAGGFGFGGSASGCGCDSFGGGGGWYGGAGSGNCRGGGGGSSYIGGVTSGITNSGVNTGNGSVVITYAGACTVATATTVNSNANPSVFGQPVTFTATVVPNPGAGATVNFVIDGGAPVATTTNASGIATTATSALSVGTHTVVANFLGATGFDPSSGTLTPVQTVNIANTTTSVTSTPNPSVWGQSVTMTATISVTSPGAGAPTGTVNFLDGGFPIPSCQNRPVSLVSSLYQASCTTSTLPVGAARFLNGVYSGDGNFNGSASPNGYTITVNKADTTTTVTSTPNPSVWGESVTMTATISVTSPGAGAPTGTVNFTDGGFAIPSCQNRPISLISSLYQASCTTSALPVGAARFLNGVYSGDGNFNGSVSPNGYTITVNKADTTTTITSDNPDPSVLGQNYTVVFSVLPVSPGAGTPSGTVAVSDGTNNCSATVAVGQCTLPSTSVGPKTLTATYPGDSSFNGSNDTEAHVVGKANTTTTVTASPASPSIFGQSVTFTATVAIQAPGAGPPNPTGTVSFNIDGNIYCANTPLTAGLTATCTQAGLPALPAGLRNVVALYGGDANFNGSAGTNNYTVNKASTTIAITGDTPDPTIIGQPYAVTWAITITAPGAGTPTGNVTVSDGTATCTAPAAAGGCSLTSTTSGNKNLVATYAGDANFNGSVSPSVPHVVNMAITGLVRNGVTLAPASGVPMRLLCVTPTTTSTTTNAAGVFTFTGQFTGPCELFPNLEFTEPFSRFFTPTGNISGANFLVYANANEFPRKISFPTQYVAPGAAGSMPIIMNSLNNEASVAFSFTYDINPFSQPPVVVCGADAPGCTVTNNTSVFGRVGFTVTAAPGGFSRPNSTSLDNPEGSGPKEIARINFQTAVTTTLPSTDFIVQNSPTAFSITEVGTPNSLTAVFLTGARVVFAQGREGDVAGRNAGNGAYEAADLVQMRRFISGLDTPVGTHNEYQRADTAPAASKGDGTLNATDLVQARRYVAGLDAGQSAGGAGAAAPVPMAPPAADRAEAESEITIGDAIATNSTRISVPVSMKTSGTEVATSFTIRYDETRLTNPNVTLADGAPEGAVLTFGKAEPGYLRILIDSTAVFGNSKDARLVDISFDVLERAPSGNTSLEIEELVFSDANAAATRSRATNGTISIAGSIPADTETDRSLTRVRRPTVDLIEEWLDNNIVTLRPREAGETQQQRTITRGRFQR